MRPYECSGKIICIGICIHVLCTIVATSTREEQQLQGKLILINFRMVSKPNFHAWTNKLWDLGEEL
jgi:hypothetical protein